MHNKKNLSRITIDLSTEDHKRFKALAALRGKTMREIVVDAIQKQLECAEKTTDTTQR